MYARLIESAGSRYHRDFLYMIRGFNYYHAGWKNANTKRYKQPADCNTIYRNGISILYNMDFMSLDLFEEELILRENVSYMFEPINIGQKVNVEIHNGAFCYKLCSITEKNNIMRIVFVNDIIEPNEEPDHIVMFYKKDMLISGFILTPVHIHLYVN